MPKKTTTIYIRGVDADYMQRVKEFALHRKMSLKTLVLLSIDQYMAKYKRKERRKAKEVSTHGNTNRKG